MKGSTLAAVIALAVLANVFNLVPVYAQQRVASKNRLINGLPPVTMDSFVYEAGAHAEHIYGDEGANGLPPYEGFTKAHRINAGIMDQRDAVLTTGHGSYMPDAWGNDEFIAPPGEWSQSGYRDHTSASGFADDGAPITNSGGSGSGGNDPNIPPPPGPGYQPVYTHGQFDGYLTPEQAAMWNSGNYAEAWKSFAKSRPGGPTANDIFIVTQEMGGSWP